MRKKTEAKLIAKKIKYGHLQKLKWYCEICRHQCNDEQSYKQHVQSEKHRMMMAHFRANSGSILKSNSQVFESTFINVLKNRFPNREVAANIVYTQVIRDKNHVHMNSTHWESLNGFCYHLEKVGKIRLRMSERGPMIKYIDQKAELELDQKKEIERIKQLEANRERETVEMMLQKEPRTKPKHEQVENVDVQRVDVVIKPGKEKKERTLTSLFGS